MEGRGFQAHTLVRLAVGPSGGPFETVDTAYITDRSGRLSAQVAIPVRAMVGELWMVQVSSESTPVQLAISNLFSVVSADEGPAPTIYIVKRGDNLWTIARSYGTTVAALLAANPGISDPPIIYPGQALVIPNGTANTGQTPAVSLTPLRGAAGSAVQVNASGFPANTPVVIGVGQADGQFIVTYDGQTDANGRLSTTAAIPASAEAGQLWTVGVFTVGTPQASAMSNLFAVTQTASDAQRTSLPVYLVALGEGQVGCGDALRAIPRTVPASDQPWQAAIEALLGVDPAAVEQAGLYNALANSSLQLESMTVDAQGTATIRLTGQLSLGGVCDNPRVAEQIVQTALQFPAVRRVMVFLNSEPLDTVLSGQG